MKDQLPSTLDMKIVNQTRELLVNKSVIISKDTKFQLRGWSHRKYSKKSINNVNDTAKQTNTSFMDLESIQVIEDENSVSPYN